MVGPPKVKPLSFTLREREFIELRYSQGLSHENIAVIWDCSRPYSCMIGARVHCKIGTSGKGYSASMMAMESLKRLIALGYVKIGETISDNESSLLPPRYYRPHGPYGKRTIARRVRRAIVRMGVNR